MLGIAAGLVFLVAAAYCGLVAFDRMTSWQRAHWGLIALSVIGFLGVTVAYIVTMIAENLRIEEREEPEWLQRLREQLIVSLLIAFGLLFSACGLSIIAEVEPASTVIVLIFGIAFAGSALWALKHHRRHRQRLIRGGHHIVARLYLPAILVFFIAGVLILAFGL